MRKLVSSLSLFIAIAPITIASADQRCDHLVLSDEPEDVILGEAGHARCFWLGGRGPALFRSCVFFPTGVASPRLGVCWRGTDRVWRYQETQCIRSSRDTDYFHLVSKGGDDRVAVLKPEHTEGWANLLPAGGTSGAMPCGSSSWRDGTPAIAPWRADFRFYLNAELGTGADLFHGSPNGDTVNTNATIVVRTTGPPWAPIVHLGSPADRSRRDVACGWGGNDRLYGDDDDTRGGEEDWLDGGAGNDYCDGDWSLTGSREDRSRSTGDLGRDCELLFDARPDPGDQIRCLASDDPLHEW